MESETTQTPLPVVLDLRESVSAGDGVFSWSDEMAKQGESRAVADIVFREDLYPRIEKSPTTVQKYAEDLGVLPPIDINQNNELIDGWHRWTAYKKAKVEQIPVVVVTTQSDAHLLELAIERNATHGLQLSQADKKKMAKRIYVVAGNRQERLAARARLSKILSVSEDTLKGWLSRAEKDLKDEAKEQALQLWLSCHTQQQIADAVGWPRQTITDWMSFAENGESTETGKTDDSDEASKEAPIKLTNEQLSDANHTTGFDLPIYNVWKQQSKSSGSSHFGNSESRWLDNLLYLYTQPFDVVVDPFAGGGSTIDVCKRRLRRYFASDRKPIVERESDIRKHDIVDESGKLILPKPPQWKDVRLVYLDPPYWKQAEGEYSEDPTDLANMDLETFNKTLSGIIKAFAGKLNGAYIALIIQPTQWNAPDHQFTDHIGDMLRAVKLHVDMRFSVPYESQQCNAQMVNWAKENKRCLVLTREIVVWRVV